jgi:hypothetical protein
MIAPLDLAAGMSEHVRTARLRRSHIIGPEEIPEPGVEFGYLSDADQQNWLDCAEAALDLLTPHIVAAREEGAREARVASVKRETVQKWLVKVVHPRIAAGKAREIRRAIEHRDLGHLLYELLPTETRLTIAFMTMGMLTAADDRLHQRVVPSITVEELGEAARRVRPPA